MSNSITNYTELQQRIAQLTSDKANKEAEIKRKLEELGASLKPVNLMKRAFTSVSQDGELRNDALAVALNIGVDYVIQKLFRSNKSVKGFVSSLLLERLTSSYVNNHIADIKSSIGSLFSRFMMGK